MYLPPTHFDPARNRRVLAQNGNKNTHPWFLQSKEGVCVIGDLGHDQISMEAILETRQNEQFKSHYSDQWETGADLLSRLFGTGVTSK